MSVNAMTIPLATMIAAVTSTADAMGCRRCDIRSWSGMSTMARDAPRRTMSMIDQNRIIAATVRMTMRRKGNWSLRNRFIDEYL